jgi:hypothetical protein
VGCEANALPLLAYATNAALPGADEPREKM